MGTISRAGAERLKRQLIRAEQGRYNDPPETSGRPGFYGYAIHFKTTGSGLAAASSVTQMTSGDVYVCEVGPTGAITVTGQTITVWNKATTSLAANKHGIAVLAAGGYVVDWIEC